MFEKRKTTTKPVEKAPKKTAPKKDVVNADEMAAKVEQTTGNDYQQYIRNLFKDKLTNRK